MELRAAEAAKAVTTIDCWEAAGKERIPVCAVAVEVELQKRTSETDSNKLRHGKEYQQMRKVNLLYHHHHHHHHINQNHQHHKKIDTVLDRV